MAYEPVLTRHVGDQDAYTLDAYVAKQRGYEGLRKALTDAGFEVTDIVLKKWGGPGGPKPAADTAEESALERLEAELRSATAALRSARLERNAREKLVDDVTGAKGLPSGWWAQRLVAIGAAPRGKERPWPERVRVYAPVVSGTVTEVALAPTLARPISTPPTIALTTSPRLPRLTTFSRRMTCMFCFLPQSQTRCWSL